MTMRLYLCVGDAPVTGGAILPNNATFSIGDAGHKVALIGGQVKCDACGSIGTIIKTGGPRRPNFMGQIALDGDACLCKCSPPPLIKAVVTNSTWYDDGDFGHTGENPTEYSEQFHLHDDDGVILKNTYYTILRESGEVVHGQTNSEGLTERHFSSKPEEFKIYLGHRDDL